MSPPVPTVWFCDGPSGQWGGVLGDVDEHGVAVAAGAVSTWERFLPAGPALRRLLGDDMRRYAALPATLRARFAATRLLAKSTAAVALRCAPHEVALGYSARGRMFVRGQDHTHLSLSHTADIAVVALSHRGPVGVDVERSTRDIAACDISSMMCTPAERAGLQELDAATQRAALLRTWTLKEAYSKALGQGMLFPFTEFGFDVTAASGSAVLKRADHSDVDDPMWVFCSWTEEFPGEPAPYVLGLAVPGHGGGRPELRGVTARRGLVTEHIRARRAPVRGPAGADASPSPVPLHRF